MGDQPPTAGTTLTPPPEHTFLEAVVSLKDDKQRAALESYITSQLTALREAPQRVGTAVLEVAQSTPFIGPTLSKKFLQVAKDLAAPVARAKVVHNPNLQTIDAAAAADPIELATGQLLYTHTDLSLDGAGIRFEFIRTYRSQARYPNGPLGAAWDHSYNLWLREVDANTFVVGTGQLREDRYHRISPGGTDPDYFAADAGNDSILILNARTNKYELHVPGGIAHQFAPLGAFHAEDAGLHRLERTFDRFQVRNALTGEPQSPGNSLRFIYDLNDTHLLRAIEVNHPTRQVLLDYDDLGRIVTLTDYAGRRVTYTYDDYDDLVAVTLPATQDRRYGRSTFYQYSSATGPLLHMLTNVLDADGRRYLEVEYGIEEGFTDHQRVIRQRDNEGEWLLQYADLHVEPSRDPNNPADPDLPIRYTSVIQPNGHEIEYWFNELGGILFRADRYFDGNRVPRRALWRYQYNPDGKLIASLSPEGVFVQQFYARDEYALTHGLRIADSLAAMPPPTASQRQSFGTLLAIIRRAKAPLLLNWPDPTIANGILNTAPDDIVQMFESDPDSQLPLRISDPRSTADPVTPPARWLKSFEYSPDVHQFPLSVSYPATQRPDGTPVPAAKELFLCDPNGRVIDHTDPEGHTTRNAYYQDTDPPAVPDKRFGVELILQPNLLRRTGYLKSTTAGHGESNAATRQFEVNRRGMPIIITDARGAVTKQVLDASDQPVEVTRTLRAGVDYTTKYRYTGQAKVFRTEAAIQDDTGQPVLIDGTTLGTAVRQTRYTDIEQIRRESVGGPDSRTWLTTRHLYNGSGLPTKHFSPGDSITRVGYDSRRLPTNSTQGFNTEAAIEIKTLYDGDGRSIATVDGRGCMMRTEYDPFGRRLREIQVVDLPIGAPDARPLEQRHGHTRVFDYDKLDNVILERFFQWLPGDAYELLSRTQFEFDERGRKIREIRDVFPGPVNAGAAALNAFANAAPPDATQIETWFFLDRNDRVIERRDGVVTVGADASPGACQEFEYDHSGRVVVARTCLLDQAKAESTRTESIYDLNGNLLRTDRFDFEYDSTGALIATELISNAFEYDALNRRVTEIDGLGSRTTHRYDSRDLILETTDPLGNRTTFDFDLYRRRQRITQYPAPTREILSSFEFDADGQIIAVTRGDETNAALATIRYTYNAAHRKTSATLGLGTPFERITTWHYDPAGNAIAQTQPSGLEIRTTYDHANRIAQGEFDDAHRHGLNPPVGGAQVERFERDGLGRIVLAETDGGVTSVNTEYDSLGRALTETQSVQGEPDMTVRRVYGALGQRTSLTYPSNHKLQFDTDLSGRLVQVTDASRGAPNIGLPGAGPRQLFAVTHVGQRRRSEKTFASGVQTVHAYDAAGRVIAIDHQSASGASMLNLVSLSDAAHNIRADWQQGTDALTPAQAYDYDGLNRLRNVWPVTAAAPNIAPFAPSGLPVTPLTGQAAIDAVVPPLAAPSQSYQYDAGSNRIAETVGASVTPVDPLDRLIGPTYDDMGNPVSLDAATLQFDGRNRLVRWDDGAKTFEAVYDALGRRVLIEEGPVSKRRFVYDGTSEIAEYRDGALFAESLVTAPPDGRSIVFCGGEQFVLHADRLNSTRLVTDSSGGVIGRYDFDPYGQVMPGGIELPSLTHRFMGREWDAPLALYYFRARHYDPATGAFLQRDPVDDSAGVSAYRAFASNPLIFVDPMGTTVSHPGDRAPLLASTPSAVRTGVSSLYRNVSVRTGKVLEGPLNLYSNLGYDNAAKASGYVFDETTLYQATLRSRVRNWEAASEELAMGEGLNMGSIRSFGLAPENYKTKIQWNDEIPAFRRTAGFQGALTLLGGAAFLYSSAQQADPARKRVEQVLGVGQVVAGSGYTAAAALRPPKPPAVISPLRVGAMRVFGAAAKVLGPAAWTYSIAAPFAELIELTQIEEIRRNQMTDAERVADDARRAAEWEEYRKNPPIYNFPSHD